MFELWLCCVMIDVIAVLNHVMLYCVAVCLFETLIVSCVDMFVLYFFREISTCKNDRCEQEVTCHGFPPVVVFLLQNVLL